MCVCVCAASVSMHPHSRPSWRPRGSTRGRHVCAVWRARARGIWLMHERRKAPRPPAGGSARHRIRRRPCGLGETALPTRPGPRPPPTAKEPSRRRWNARGLPSSACRPPSLRAPPLPTRGGGRRAPCRQSGGAAQATPFARRAIARRERPRAHPRPAPGATPSAEGRRPRERVRKRPTLELAAVLRPPLGRGREGERVALIVVEVVALQQLQDLRA